MTKAMIEYEINQITVKLREITRLDLWDRYDVKYLEDRLEELRAELRKFEIK